jgi:hypothetical protein
MTQAKPATRVCGACNETLLSAYNPGTVCASCERALFTARELIEISGSAVGTAQLAVRGDVRTAAGGRLPLVPRTDGTSGTEVTGA